MFITNHVPLPLEIDGLTQARFHASRNKINEENIRSKTIENSVWGHGPDHVALVTEGTKHLKRSSMPLKQALGIAHIENPWVAFIHPSELDPFIAAGVTMKDLASNGCMIGSIQTTSAEGRYLGEVSKFDLFKSYAALGVDPNYVSRLCYDEPTLDSYNYSPMVTQRTRKFARALGDAISKLHPDVIILSAESEFITENQMAVFDAFVHNQSVTIAQGKKPLKIPYVYQALDSRDKEALFNHQLPRGTVHVMHNNGHLFKEFAVNVGTQEKDMVRPIREYLYAPLYEKDVKPFNSGAIGQFEYLVPVKFPNL